MSEDASAWQTKLSKLESRLEKYIRESARVDDEDEDAFEEGGRLSPSVLTRILHSACTLVRRAQERDEPDLPEIVDKVGELLDRTIEVAYGRFTGISYLPSFSHAKDSLVKDPMKGQLGGEGWDFAAHFEAQFLGLPPPKNTARGPGIAGFVPWMKELDRPHPQTTPLSRFRMESRVPPEATYPLANVVYQARCEITDEPICTPIRMMLSSGGSCLALTSAGGWKHQDPFLDCWVLDDDGKTGHFELVPGLANLAIHLEMDETRKLVFAADSDRIKSYSWAKSSGKPVHTMKCGSHDGPIAQLPDGRLLRAGTGSALAWTLEDLDTHGPRNKRVGWGTYRGFERSHRLVEEEEMELSVGSEPTGTVPFADMDLMPLNWHWHKPTKTMLIAENPSKRRSYACAMLDLEHGGHTVTRFLGHGGRVAELSSSDGDPDLFVTACSDGFARLYDVRHPLPSMTFDVERENATCYTAAIEHIDGIPVIFTGGQKTESVKLWDPRNKKVMYELATGNNSVTSVVWNPRDTTLYAATECDYRDRMGAYHGYRPARPLDLSKKEEHGKQKETEKKATKNETTESAKEKRERSKDDESDSDEYTDESSESEESEESEESDDDPYKDWDGVKCWPERAYHSENFFGEMFDAGDHLLLRYHFKTNADPFVIPQYGRARLGEDNEAGCPMQ